MKVYGYTIVTFVASIILLSTMQSDSEHCNHGPFVQICSVEDIEYLHDASGQVVPANDLHKSIKIQNDVRTVRASINVTDNFLSRLLDFGGGDLSTRGLSPVAYCWWECYCWKD